MFTDSERDITQRSCACIPRMRYIASFGVSDRRIANMSVTRCVICLLRKRDMFAMRTLYLLEGSSRGDSRAFPRDSNKKR